MADDKYNGWTNYESWIVALWLDNDQGSQEWARELVAEYPNDYRAGDALRNEIEDTQPRLNGMFSDLMTHALGRVDWAEVARHFRDE